MVNGGDCSLCRSKGTNKRNCPLNANAKQKNTDKHYKIITKDYLQGFIDLHNNELEHWDAVEFLEWLKLNDFKIVKN